MNKIKSSVTLTLAIIFSSVSIFFSSCNDSTEGKIIITVVNKLQNSNFLTGEAWRYIPKAQIAIIDPANAESLEILTSDFYSAQSPSVSYDGKSMLFAGQKKENEPWQIWEMELGNKKARQITSCKHNCVDPVYLPFGNMLYSKLNGNDSLKAGYSLYTRELDGSDNKRITYNPSTYFATNVLMDGRLLTIGKEVHPKAKESMLMIMKPDGTKADMFYKGTSGSIVTTKGRESSDGRILFIESENGKSIDGKLVSINYNRPLHSRVDLAANIAGSFLSVFPKDSGKLVVSYRKSDSEKFALYEFDSQTKTLGKTIYSNPDFDILDAIVVKAHARPKKLPSAVKLDKNTAQLLCQDINFVGEELKDSSANEKTANTVEIVGLNSSLGIVKVEKDGSFYLKLPADQPFQIKTLDDEGNVVYGPSSWIYLRPSERRGCIGCHEDPELAPENKPALSVTKDPIILSFKN